MQLFRVSRCAKQLLALVVMSSIPACAQAPTTPNPVFDPSQVFPVDAQRWPAQRSWKWFHDQPWPCGFNYIPSHSISYTEMFMPYNFDAKKIDGELAMAQADGFNCARMVLPFVVWEHDPAAFKAEFSQLLDVCAKRGIKVMPALFDDCVFGHTADPIYGRQPVVVPGWYANGWTPSPGHAIVRDKAQWPRLEKYVKDMIGTYKNDSRVWLWDLYNEPTNGGMGDTTVPLVNKVFDWAREIDPIQPLTSDVFGTSAMQRLALDRSDVITFHNYDDAAALRANIQSLKTTGRPIICSEWMNRSQKSTPQNCLPVFTSENVGAMHWGYVNGRTQTNFRWGSKAGDPSPKLWQHDLYRSEYTVENIPAGGYGFGTDYNPNAKERTPYDPAEIVLFRQTIKDMAAKPRPWSYEQQWILPTARAYDPANVWHYTTVNPGKGWAAANFNDAAWKTGAGGFGTDAPSANTRTNWDTSDIWLRRTLNLTKVPADLTIYTHHDEDLNVYFNGQLVFTDTGYTADYKAVKLPASALEALKPGDNVIAMSCHQTTGGQYVDIGLATTKTQ